MTTTTTAHDDHTGHRLIELNDGSPFCQTCHADARRSTAQITARAANIRALIAARVEAEADRQGVLF